MTIHDALLDLDGNGNVITSNDAFKLDSTWTFAAATTGAIGQHTLFTVTGDVFACVIGFCKTSLDSGGAATLSVGSANNVAALLELATATVIDANDIWVNGDAGNPATEIVVYLASGEGTYIIGNGADITIDILDATITAGVIKFYCIWRPLSSDGNITVTTPA